MITVSNELRRKKEVGYRFNAPCCGNCVNYNAVGLLKYSTGNCVANNFVADHNAHCDLYCRKIENEI